MPHPIPDARVLDVHELRADRIRVNAFERGDHFAQGHALVIHEEFRRDLHAEVLLAEAEFAQREERILRTLVGERIQFRDRVPESSIGVNQPVNARLQWILGFGAGLQFRGRGAVSFLQIPQFEAFEKCRPGGINRPGIVLPAGVILLEEIEV